MDFPSSENFQLVNSDSQGIGSSEPEHGSEIGISNDTTAVSASSTASALSTPSLSAAVTSNSDNLSMPTAAMGPIRTIRTDASNHEQQTPSSTFRYYNSAAQPISGMSPMSPNFPNMYFSPQLSAQQFPSYLMHTQLQSNSLNIINNNNTNNNSNNNSGPANGCVQSSQSLHSDNSSSTQLNHTNWNSSSHPIEPKKHQQVLPKKIKKEPSPAAIISSSTEMHTNNTSSGSTATTTAKSKPLKPLKSLKSSKPSKSASKDAEEPPRVSRDDPKEARLQEAMRLVQEGKFSRRKAAAQTGISPNTLKRRLNGSVSRVEYLERTKKISALEEFVLECVLVVLVSQGAVIKPTSLRAVVALYLNHRNTVPGIVDESIVQQYTAEGPSSNRYYDTMVQNKSLLQQIQLLEEEIRKLKQENAESPNNSTTSKSSSTSGGSNTNAVSKDNKSTSTTVIPENGIEEFNSIPKGWCSRFLKRSKFLELSNGNISVEKSVDKKLHTAKKGRNGTKTNAQKQQDSMDQDEYDPDEALDESTSLNILHEYSIPCHPNDKEKFSKMTISSKPVKDAPAQLSTISESNTCSGSDSDSESNPASTQANPGIPSDSDKKLLELFNIASSPEFAELNRYLNDHGDISKSPENKNATGNCNSSSSSQNNNDGMTHNESIIVSAASIAPLRCVVRVLQRILQGPLSETAQATVNSNEGKAKTFYHQTVSSISSALTASSKMLQYFVSSKFTASTHYETVDSSPSSDLTVSPNEQATVLAHPAKQNVSSSENSLSFSSNICLPASGGFKPTLICSQPVSMQDIHQSQILARSHDQSSIQSTQAFHHLNQHHSHHQRHQSQFYPSHMMTASTTKRIVTPPDNIVDYLKNSNGLHQFPVTPNTPKSEYSPVVRNNHNKAHSFSYNPGSNHFGSFNTMGFNNDNISINNSSIHGNHNHMMSANEFSGINNMTAAVSNMNPSTSFHRTSASATFENIFKVNVGPAPQRQQQQLHPQHQHQPFKMVIETGIKSPKKRKRIVSVMQEEKEENGEEEEEEYKDKDTKKSKPEAGSGSVISSQLLLQSNAEMLLFSNAGSGSGRGSNSGGMLANENCSSSTNAENGHVSDTTTTSQLSQHNVDSNSLESHSSAGSHSSSPTTGEEEKALGFSSTSVNTSIDTIVSSSVLSVNSSVEGISGSTFDTSLSSHFNIKLDSGLSLDLRHNNGSRNKTILESDVNSAAGSCDRTNISNHHVNNSISSISNINSINNMSNMNGINNLNNINHINSSNVSSGSSMSLLEQQAVVVGIPSLLPSSRATTTNKYKSDVQSLSAPSQPHILGEVNLSPGGGNMSEYVNFEYEDDF